MSYVHRYFDKPFSQLAYSDVLHFFSSPRFSSQELVLIDIDHTKSYDQELKKIISAVCALFNSNGGTIIWGAPTPKSVVGSKAQCYQGLLTTRKDFPEREKLINLVAEKIIPYTTDFHLELIQCEDGQICISTVPESSQAPHQYKDRYYTMYEGSPRIAPHHFIEAMFKKNAFPRLEGYIKLKGLRDNGLHYCIDLEVFIFNFSTLYNETSVSFSLSTNKGTFLKLKFGSDPRVYRMGGEQAVRSGVLEILHYGIPFSKELMLMVSPKDIINSKFQLELNLQFGGEKSPLKESNYLLDLSQPFLENSNELIIRKSENQVVHEKSPDANRSREEILKAILEKDN